MRKSVRILFIIVGFIVLIAIAGQGAIESFGASRWDNPHKNPIQTDNYELLFPTIDRFQYREGDLLLLRRNAQPDIGNIVYYEADENLSNCMAFGPGVDFAKIAGLPCDTVVVNAEYYMVNGKKYIYEERYFIDDKLHTRQYAISKLMWGDKAYDDVTAGIELRVPDNEYLADTWIGYDCSPRKHDDGPYARLTVKQEALIGIVLCRLGHSFYFEKKRQNIVY